METLNLTEILSYLLEHPRPVEESGLLRRFLPGTETLMARGVSVELYRAHFTLYHHLFRLAEALERSRYYLHIHLIHVHLLEKPEGGRCRHFDSAEVRFCGAPSGHAGEESLCDRHRLEGERLRAQGALSRIGLSAFYLDAGNIDAFGRDRLDRLTRGVFLYMAEYREIEHSLEVLGLPIGCSSDRLHERYRYLSKRYHPDLGRPDGAERFAEITGAYHCIARFKRFESGLE